jgi:hypothetical protein
MFPTTRGTRMVTDIFEFWSQIGPREKIHPADADVFRRLGESHGFPHTALPGHFMGPLKSAPIVMLYISPGLDAFDEVFAKTDEGVMWHADQRKGDGHLPLGNSGPGVAWWLARTKRFGASPEVRASNIAILNIGAYHSKEMKDTELLAALPSSRVALSWAQSELFPQAEQGERVVICARAAKFWGLSPGTDYPGTLFARPVAWRSHEEC